MKLKSILEAISNWILEYGKASAGAPSFRGSYEAPVPEQLIETLKN